MVCCAAACPSPRWHRVFLSLLPALLRHARYAFRHLHGEAREEAIQAVLCNACTAVARLAELDKLDLCYGSVLARYAVAQVKDGRRTGGHLNCRDVSSAYCQRHQGIVLERLDHFSEEDQAWNEVLVEDKTAGPADIARTRIDFDAWLHALPRRDRRVAEYLSLGNRTQDAAQEFGVTEGRISQLRRELARSWSDFTGDSYGNAG